MNEAIKKSFSRIRLLSDKSSLQKKLVLFISLITVLVLSGIISCESSTDSEDQPDLLRVKFTNDSLSAYTISIIQLQPMGRAGESTDPAADWGDNILAEGARLAPGEMEFFNLEIPNLHWSRYRLGVISSNGDEIMLHEQTGYQPDLSDPSITHWGSDERTVSVTVVDNLSTGFIDIASWSDFAGIE